MHDSCCLLLLPCSPYRLVHGCGLGQGVGCTPTYLQHPAASVSLLVCRTHVDMQLRTAQAGTLSETEYVDMCRTANRAMDSSPHVRTLFQ